MEYTFAEPDFSKLDTARILQFCRSGLWKERSSYDLEKEPLGTFQMGSQQFSVCGYAEYAPMDGWQDTYDSPYDAPAVPMEHGIRVKADGYSGWDIDLPAEDIQKWNLLATLSHTAKEIAKEAGLLRETASSASLCPKEEQEAVSRVFEEAARKDPNGRLLASMAEKLFSLEADELQELARRERDSFGKDHPYEAVLKKTANSRAGELPMRLVRALRSDSASARKWIPKILVTPVKERDEILPKDRSGIVPRYMKAFPDYDDKLKPLAGFRDASYEMEAMPKIQKTVLLDPDDPASVYGSVVVWQDYKSPAFRDQSDAMRYTVEVDRTGEEEDFILQTGDWRKAGKAARLAIKTLEEEAKKIYASKNQR